MLNFQKKIFDIKIIKQNIKDHKDLFGRNIYYKKESLNNSFPEYILKNKKILKNGFYKTFFKISLK